MVRLLEFGESVLSEFVWYCTNSILNTRSRTKTLIQFRICSQILGSSIRFDRDCGYVKVKVVSPAFYCNGSSYRSIVLASGSLGTLQAG